jgi:uncharacterized protein (TIGR02246 family)
MTTLPRVLIIVLLALAPTGAAFASPADEASAVIDHWAAAYSANDTDAVVKLYAQDAILLATTSPLLAEGTGPIRAYFARLPGSGNKVAMGERRMVVLGDSAVLGTGFYEFTLAQDGKPVPTPARFTMVLVKRGSDWFITHHHSSQRPKPPQ